MKQVAAVGLDMAKHVFQAHGLDKAGRMVLKRKLRRREVGKFFVNLEPCVVGIEASGSAHDWARVLRAAGHTVRLMAPQFVKPYVKSNKNDANDAEAIAEAVMRPNMRFVAPKSVEQQDMQCLHLHVLPSCGTPPASCSRANCVDVRSCTPAASWPRCFVRHSTF